MTEWVAGMTKGGDGNDGVGGGNGGGGGGNDARPFDKLRVSGGRWIPAFAGMTEWVAGMTEWVAGMAK